MPPSLLACEVIGLFGFQRGVVVAPSSSTKYVSGSTTRAASVLSSVWLRGDDPTVHSNTALPRRRILGCTPHRAHVDRGHRHRVYGGIGDAGTHCSAGAESYFVLRTTFSHPVPHQHPPTLLISEEPVRGSVSDVSRVGDRACRVPCPYAEAHACLR